MRLGLTLIAMLAAGLAACAGPPGVFRSDRSDPLLTAPPLTEVVAGGVFVGPVAGVEADPFRHAMADALTRRLVPAGVAGVGLLGATLSGVPDASLVAAAGYVNVVWRLERVDGLLLDSFQTPMPVDFRIERPETRASIAAIADRLAAMLGPKQPPNVETRIIVSVPPAVTEGFTDGGPLARAMATALATKGYQPGDASTAQATVRATARVAATPGRPDLALVSIRWAVLDRNGMEVGVADQANSLPNALVGDGLASIAADAAAAAVDSVAGLIRLAADVRAPSTAAGAH